MNLAKSGVFARSEYDLKRLQIKSILVLSLFSHLLKNAYQYYGKLLKAEVLNTPALLL